MKKILAWLRSEPALIAAVINIAIALAATKGFHLSRTNEALVWTAAAALLGISVRQLVSPTKGA